MMNMGTLDISRALVQLAGQERLVKGRFWHKVRTTLGKVPFLEWALATYYAATDSATPRHVKGVLIAALAYFIVPTDLIPDFIVGVGYTDDAAVLLSVVQTLAPYITDGHLRRARGYLEKEHRKS
jgi:uncharacterized membrane protein YkvA (DUF1232 family)